MIAIEPKTPDRAFVRSWTGMRSEQFTLQVPVTQTIPVHVRPTCPRDVEQALRDGYIDIHTAAWIIAVRERNADDATSAHQPKD